MMSSFYSSPPISETVCFTGHRKLTVAERSILQTRFQTVLDDLYQNGYRFFLCGGALGFDTLAALSVLELRAVHSDVQLHMIIPCKSQSFRWTKEDQQIYQQICRLADQVVILSDFYYAGCMLTRNRFMVDHSSFCLGYMTQACGGTWSTIRYALHKNLYIVNLAFPYDRHYSNQLKEKPWNYMFISPFVSENVNIVRLHPLQVLLKPGKIHISRSF